MSGCLPLNHPRGSEDSGFPGEAGRRSRPAGARASKARLSERGDVMGSVVKKRRKKIAKHKYKKLRKRMRHQRRKK